MLVILEELEDSEREGGPESCSWQGEECLVISKEYFEGEVDVALFPSL